MCRPTRIYRHHFDDATMRQLMRRPRHGDIIAPERVLQSRVNSFRCAGGRRYYCYRILAASLPRCSCQSCRATRSSTFVQPLYTSYSSTRVVGRLVILNLVCTCYDSRATDNKPHTNYECCTSAVRYNSMPPTQGALYCSFYCTGHWSTLVVSATAQSRTLHSRRLYMSPYVLVSIVQQSFFELNLNHYVQPGQIRLMRNQIPR